MKNFVVYFQITGDVCGFGETAEVAREKALKDNMLSSDEFLSIFDIREKKFHENKFGEYLPLHKAKKQFKSVFEGQGFKS